MTTDVLVVGKGPAALAAAAALAGEGLAVTVLGPPGAPRWSATYAAWADELRQAGHPDAAAHVWPEAAVQTSGEGPRVLPRAYAVLHNERLAASLVARCEAAGVRWASGEARAATHTAEGTTVRAADGAEHAARLVVDASGHRPALVCRPEEPPQAFQSAVGFLLRVEDEVLPPRRAVLMDWRDDHLGAGEERGPPTFLYALPLGEGRVFVEETALAARPAAPYPLLERRLRLRLEAMGLDAALVERTERVWIPMGGALPDGGQRVVGFGAAAGMVHPATGYSVVRSLAAAPALARTIARALGRPGASPERAARAAWETLWSADDRRRYALQRFGMEVLLTLDPAETRGFFDGFFRLPPEDWGGYLAGTLPAAGLARVMARFFALAPAALRTRMTTSAMGPMGRELAGTWLGSFSRLFGMA